MKKVLIAAAACLTLALGASAQTELPSEDNSSTTPSEDGAVIEQTTPQESDRATYDEDGYPVEESADSTSSDSDYGTAPTDTTSAYGDETTTPETYDPNGQSDDAVIETDRIDAPDEQMMREESVDGVDDPNSPDR